MLNRIGYGTAPQPNIATDGLFVNFTNIYNLPAFLTFARSTTALYQDSNGDYFEAAIDTPRLGYLFEQGPGLINEESITCKNEYARPSSGTQSDHFGSTVGYVSIVSDTSNPFNNLTNGDQVWKIDAAGGGQRVRGMVGTTGNTNQHSMGCWVRVEQGTARIKLFSSSGFVEVETSSSDWTYISMDDITPGGTGNTLSLQADTDSIAYFVGANLQESAYMTSIIDTAGASAARGDDRLSLDSSLLSTTAGSMIIDYIDTNPKAANANQQVLYAGDGTTANRVSLIKNNSPAGRMNFRITNASSDVASFDFAPDLIQGTRHSFGLAYAGDDAVMTYNGIKVHADTSLTLFSDFSGDLGIGNLPTGSSALPCILLRFKYFDTRITDIKLERFSNTIIDVGNITYDPDAIAIIERGQSNSAGRGDVASAPIYANTSLMKMIGQDGILTAYSDPYDDNTDALFSDLQDASNGLSHAGQTIDTLAGALSQTIIVMGANKNGSSITEWESDVVDDIYLTSVLQSRLAEKAAGTIVEVWHQGETDANTGMSQAAYVANLKALVASIRKHTNDPLRPFVIVGLHAYHTGIHVNTTQSEWEDIQAAQEQAASEITNAAFVDLSDLAGESGDEVHLSDASYITAGTRIATAIQTLLS